MCHSEGQAMEWMGQDQGLGGWQHHLCSQGPCVSLPCHSTVGSRAQPGARGMQDTYRIFMVFPKLLLLPSLDFSEHIQDLSF